jgi:UDP-glucuronate 4-epimerase
MAIHKFARLISEGKSLPVYGDGTSSRDYTFVDDIVDGVMGALEHLNGFDIINLGESRTVELRELITLLEEALGRQAVIEYLPEQPGDVPVTYADINKAHRLLGYRPQVPIEEGIARFVAWFKGGTIRGSD